MTIEFKSIEEAEIILHCLQRSNARDKYGDLENILDTCDMFEFRLWELIRSEKEKTKETDE